MKMKKMAAVVVCAAVASAIALGVRAEVVYVDAYAEEGGDGQTASPNLFFYNNKFKDNCGDGGKKIFWAKFYGSYSDHAHANWVQGDVDAKTFPMGGTDGNIVSDSERNCINAGETLAWMVGAKTFDAFEPIVTERTAGYGIDIDFGKRRSRLAAGAPDIGAEESAPGMLLLVW